MKRNIKKIISGVLVTVMACTVFAFAGCEDKKEVGFDDVGSNEPKLEDYNGQLVEDGKSYAFSDKIAFMSTTSGRSNTTGTEFVPVEVELVATVEPADANQEVLWTFEFVDPTSDWATSKKVTDYLSVSSAGGGSTTATVTCKQPFGEQIKIICTSAENSAISAECVVDFVKAIKEITVSWGDTKMNIGGQTDVYWEVNKNGVGCGGNYDYQYIFYEDYTIESTFSEVYFRLNSPEGYFSNEGYSVNDSWGAFSHSKYTSNNHNDGYFVIGGYDFSIPSAAKMFSLYEYGDQGLYSKWYDTSDKTYFASLDFDYSELESCYTYIDDVWTCATSIDPTELVTMSIDNGYLWTFSLFYYVNNETLIFYGSTLINLAGFTNNPLVQSVSLGSSSLIF